jgi:hypothetical protein
LDNSKYNNSVMCIKGYLVSEWASVVISGEWVSECCCIWWVSERVLLYLVSEWASVVISGERVFNSKWAIFQLYLSRWEQVTFRWDDNDFHFVLNPELSWIFYSSSSLKQQSAGSYVALLWNIMLIPKPTSLCSYRYFFKLHA